MSQSLRPFFDIVGPFLLGKASHEETVQRLYGDEATGRARSDAQRLAIYGRFCRIHRHQALTVFPATRAAFVDALGEPAWDSLVERYFVTHPMHHFELNQNGEYLPQFLAALLAADDAPALPPFLAELADFEWAEWQTRIAPDDANDADEANASDPSDATRGPLRVGSTVDLRPYHHDFVGWLDTDPSERPAAPEAREALVIFWRDRSLASRRDLALPKELVILKALLQDIALDEALATQVGLPFATLTATLADLHAAGIVRGALVG